MSAELNHTIVSASDPDSSARFMADILGLAEPTHYGPFTIVEAGNRVSLDFMQTSGEVVAQHYAFLVSETEFDKIFSRIRGRDLNFWADPGHHKTGEINRRDGGRGVYFDDPNGHSLEILTRPYGSGD